MVSLGGGRDLNLLHEWFKARGFGVHFTSGVDECGDRFFWANLTRLPSGRVVAPKYGRGATEVTAAHSAQERFKVEQ